MQKNKKITELSRRKVRGVMLPTGRKLYWAGCKPWTMWSTFLACRKALCWAGERPGCRQNCGRSERLWIHGSESKQRRGRVQTGRKADRWRRMEWCSPGRCGDTCRIFKKKEKSGTSFQDYRLFSSISFQLFIFIKGLHTRANPLSFQEVVAGSGNGSWCPICRIIHVEMYFFFIRTIYKMK